MIPRAVLGRSNFHGSLPRLSQRVLIHTSAPTITTPTALAVKRHRRMPAIIRPVVPSQRLLDFCNNVEDKAQSRSTIVKIMSNYIKENNLQNPDNRRIVYCDEKLKSLFGVDQCTMLEVGKYVTPYLHNPEDLGGRYVEEARLVEVSYFEKKDAEKAAEKESKASSARSAPGERRVTKPRVFKQLVLSPDLAKVCKAAHLSRPQVLKAVWVYITENDLKSGSGKPVKCDALLQKVFGLEEIDVPGVMKGIAPHLSSQASNS